MPDVSDPADLYGLPLEEFTDQRNVLVRRLREEGRTEEASQTAKLRKPTTDAWALNQVARNLPEAVHDLIEVHDQLRQADDAEALRKASEERRRLVEELAEAAASALEDSGHSPGGPVRDRIMMTLLAAVGDPAAGKALARGTLDRALEISEQWPTSVLPRSETISSEDPGWIEEVERLEATVEELSSKAEELQQVAKQARDVLAEARSRAQEADRAARDAEKAVAEAERDLRAARQRRRSGT